MPRTLPVAAAALIAALTTASHADVFVDVAAGDDLTGDGSAAKPWRSITFAVTQVSPPETIVAAPGDYRKGTGEQFPVTLPAGVSLVASGNPENTRLVGETISAFGTPDVVVIRGTGAVGARTLLRGFTLLRGSTGLSIEDDGVDQDFAVDLDEVVLDENAVNGLRVLIDQGGTVAIDARAVFARTAPRGARLRATKGTIVAEFARANLSGLINGLELRAQGQPGASAVVVSLSATRLFGSTVNGLNSSVTEGNTIVGFLRDSLLAFNGQCIGGTPLPTAGAIADGGAADGQVFYEITRTIFHANGSGCAGGNKDLVTYRPADYTLADNVYRFAGLPGGVVTETPGFVDPSKVGIDWHLLPGSVAIDLGQPTASPYPWGDEDGDFPIQDAGSSFFEPGLDDGAACFVGTADAGPDERRAFAVYAKPAPVVGQSSTLRALGPPQGAGASAPIRAWYFLGAPPAAPSQCPTQLELPAGAFAVGAVDLDSTTGLGELPIAVPDDPKLAGAKLGLQAVFVDIDALQASWSRAVTLLVRRP